MSEIELAIAVLQDANTDAEWNAAVLRLWTALSKNENEFRNTFIDFTDHTDAEIDEFVNFVTREN